MENLSLLHSLLKRLAGKHLIVTTTRKDQLRQNPGLGKQNFISLDFVSFSNLKNSNLDVSFFVSHTYKQQVYDHLGMNKKRLEPYNPLAKRSQLPKPSVVMPYKNSSQIVIGDRASYKPKHFEATNRMFLQAPDLHEATTNPGILARRTLWTHRH